MKKVKKADDHGNMANWIIAICAILTVIIQIISLLVK